MIDRPRQTPDFSDGEQFLAELRDTLASRQRRNRWIAGATSLVSAGFLFVLSFSALQQAHYREVWEDYLLSEMTFDYVDEEQEADLEMYLNWLVAEDDFDTYLSGIFEFDLEEELIFAYSGEIQ